MIKMTKADRYYVDNLRNILAYGSIDENPRPVWGDGVTAHTKFVTQVYEEYNIGAGEFPIPTLRNTAIKTGIKEILWIYQAQTSDLTVANEMGIHWWQPWDIGDGTIGQRYGATVSKYDLVNKLLEGLKSNPFSRRHIMNLWQEDDLKEVGGLDPCAYETIWSVRKFHDRFILDMTLIQRSSDYITAGHINKTQYVALQMMIASHLGYTVGKFVHFVQNLHIYDRHIDAAKEVINNKPLNFKANICLPVNKNFYDITLDDFVFDISPDVPKLNNKLEIAI